MKHIETTITINASPATVWHILTDSPRYAEWNPFIVKMEGSPAVGQRITNTMQLPQAKPQVFKPKVLALDQEKQFRWLGSLPIPGLFNGEHYFELLPQNGGQSTKLIHGERFTGLLAGIIMKKIGQNTHQGFEAMNQAPEIPGRGRVMLIKHSRAQKNGPPQKFGHNRGAMGHAIGAKNT